MRPELEPQGHLIYTFPGIYGSQSSISDEKLSATVVTQHGQQIIKTSTMIVTGGHISATEYGYHGRLWVAWVNSLRVSYTSHAAVKVDFLAGNHPGFEPGISLTTKEDAGTLDFHERCSAVLESEVLIEH